MNDNEDNIFTDIFTLKILQTNKTPYCISKLHDILFVNMILYKQENTEFMIDLDKTVGHCQNRLSQVYVLTYTFSYLHK